MYYFPHEIMLDVYKHFLTKMNDGIIPINMSAPSLVGTVQDDPFDTYIDDELRKAFPNLEVVSSGKLTTPDIILRDKKTKVVVGLEIKKLIQKPNGADSRGLTLDYNSCLPCGQASIKIGTQVADVPCYYLFALLSNDSTSIVTLILMHGDFLNYDFPLHKHSKLANTTEYGHGPYGEGSVRHRAMYTYPNPLNHKLDTFHLRKTLVLKTPDCDQLNLDEYISHIVLRKDINGNSYSYSVVDTTNKSEIQSKVDNIFADCKARKPKERQSSAMPVLEKI